MRATRISEILLLILANGCVCTSFAYSPRVRCIVFTREGAPLRASTDSPRAATRRVALSKEFGSILALGLGAWSNILPAKAEDQQELPQNPLNLKGQYWQTGTIVYKQKLSTDDLSADPSVLLGELIAARDALANLNSVVKDGDLRQVEAGLHGGVVSEKDLVLRARALSEFIEDEDKESNAQKAFERFIRRFEDLDETVGLALKKVPSSELESSLSTIGLAVISPLSAINEAARAKSPQTTSFSGYTQLEISKALGKSIRELDAFCLAAADGIPPLSGQVKQIKARAASY